MGKPLNVKLFAKRCQVLAKACALPPKQVRREAACRVRDRPILFAAMACEVGLASFGVMVLRIVLVARSPKMHCFGASRIRRKHRRILLGRLATFCERH